MNQLFFIPARREMRGLPFRTDAAFRELSGRHVARFGSLAGIPSCLAVVSLLLAPGVAKADYNWNGNNSGAVGNMSFSDNWYFNTVPSFGFGGSLHFSFNGSGASESSIFHDLGFWPNVDNIYWDSTFGGPGNAIPWNTAGNGFNFNQRLENDWTGTVTVNTPTSGDKNGAGHIELNPVNGPLILNANVFNDNNSPFQVWGNNTNTLTINTNLTGNSGVSFTIEQYSIAKFTAAQTWGGSSSLTVSNGELWIDTGGSLAVPTVKMSALAGYNNGISKFWLSAPGGGLSATNAIVVNSGGTDVLGGLNNSGTTNIFTGAVTLNGPVQLNAFNSGATVIFSGVVSGANAVTVGGSGTVVLSGTNTYSGGANVSSGTLKVGQVAALGTVTPATVASGGTLDLAGLSPTNAIFISGTGAGSNPALWNSATTNATTISSVTLNTNATIGNNSSDRSFMLTLSSLNLNSKTLTIATGAVAIAIGNIPSGTINVTNGGILESEGTAASGSVSGTITVSTGGKMETRDTSNTGMTSVHGITLNGGQLGTATINNNNGGGAGTILKNNITVGSSGGTLNGNNTAFGIYLRLTGSISGSGALTLTGGKGVEFQGDPSGYTGTATANGGTVSFNSSANQTFNGILAGTQPLSKTGSGTLTLASNNTYSGLTTVNGGTLLLTGNPGTSAGTIGSSAIVLTNGATLSFGGSDTIGFGSTKPITNYSSTITLSGGSYHETINRPIYLNGGTITSPNAGDGTPYNDFGATIFTMPNSGTSTISLPNGGNFALRLNATFPIFNVAAGTTLAVSAPLVNYSGNCSFTLNGGGTMLLSNTNTYSGPTIVNASTLLGLTGGSCSNSLMIVTNGGGIGVRVLNTGAQWTCGGLNLAASGTDSTTNIFNFNAANPSTTTAPIFVNGNLTNNGTLNVSITGGALTNGTYPLIKYTGTLAVGTLGSVSLPGGTASLVNNTANKSIDLNVTAGNQITWQGGSGTWDINTTANWTNSSGTAVKYIDGNAVVFDDSSPGTSPLLVTLGATMNPANVIFNISSKSYNLGTNAGNAAINGTTMLTKSGTGTLTLTNANGYSGGTILNAGTLSIGNGTSGENTNALGTGTVTLNGGTLLIQPGGSSVNWPIPNAISLNGGTIQGKDGFQHFVGPMFVGASGGTLNQYWDSKSVWVDGVLSGSGPLAITAGSGGSFSGIHFSNPSNTYSGTITVSGNSATIDVANALSNATLNVTGAGSRGALQWGTGVTNILLGALSGSVNVTNGANALSVGYNNSSTLFSGALVGTTGSFIKLGTGTFLMTGANVNAGATTVSGGTLALAGSWNGGGTISVSDGATLSVQANGATSVVTNAASLTLGTSGASTLTISNFVGNATAPIFVTNVTANGTVTVNIANAAGTTTLGQWPLIKYSGTLNSFSPFVLGALPRGVTATLVNNTGNSSIDLSVTSVNTNLYWNGNVSGNWDINTTTNWRVATVASTYTDGSGVILDDSATGTTFVTNNLTLNPASVTFSNVTKNYLLAGTGIITNLTKNGTGTLTNAMSGLGTAGTLTLNAGTTELQTGANAATWNLAANATLRLGYNYGGNWTVNGNGSNDASGLYLKIGTTLNHDGGTVQNGSTFIRTYGGTGSATMQGFDVHSTFLTVQSTASGSLTDTNINFSTGSFGYRISVASGSSNAIGDFTIRGAITGGGGDNGGEYSPAPPQKVAFSKFGTGSLNLSGASSFTQPGLLIGGGSVILSSINNPLPTATTVYLGQGSTSGTLVLNGISQTLGGVATLGTGTANAVVGGSATMATLTINNATAFTNLSTIGGAGANQNNLNLVKSGAGTLSLMGSLFYTGNTTVNAGTLAVGSLTNTDGSVLSVVDAGGSLAATNLALGTSAGSTLAITAFANSPTAPIIVTNLTAKGVTSITLAGSFASGQYPLIQYLIGGINGGGSFVVQQSGLPRGVSAVVVTNVPNSSIDVVLTANPLLWVGATNGVNVAAWDNGVTTNWSLIGAPNYFTNNDNVQIDDSATGSTVLNLVANASPFSVLVTNVAQNFTISATGSAALTGGMSLTKQGTGILTLASSNSFSGGGAINGGVINLQNGYAFNTNTVTVNSGAELELQGGINVAPATSLTLKSTGTNNTGGLRNVSGNNIYGGAIALSASSTRINSDSGTLTLTNGVVAGANKVTLGGNGNITISGAAVTGSGGLTKDGSGTNIWNVNPNISSGGVSVNAGTLQINANNFAASFTPLLNVNSGATLWGTGTHATGGNASLVISNGTWLMSAEDYKQNLTLLDAVISPGPNPVSAGGELRVGFAGGGGVWTYYVSNSVVGSTLNCKLNTIGANVTNIWNVTRGSAASDLTINGVIANSGSLVFTGNGITTLNATNTCTGITLVQGGRLIIGATGVVSTNIVNVANATLSGSGIVNGATTVQAGGTLQPGLGGADTSALTINNNLQLGGNALFVLNRTNAQNSSRITGISAVNYGGALVVSNAGPALQPGDTFTLFQATNYAGAFASLSLPALTAPLTWNTNNLAINGSISVQKAPTTLTLTSSANPSGFNDGVTFVADLGDVNPTGTVVFQTNGVTWSTGTLVNGAVTNGPLSVLPRGTNNITAIYGGDANYLGSSASLNQVVTNHPPSLQTMVVTRTAGLVSRLTFSDIATNWSDADGDTLSLNGLNLVTTNGVNLVTNASWILYSNPLNVADQISYTVADSFGATSTGYINIVIAGSVTGTNSISSITPGSTNLVTAHGIPGFNYILERATNLVPVVWVMVSTNAANTNGVINATDDFSDIGGIPPSSAYYRLKWQP